MDQEMTEESSGDFDKEVDWLIAGAGAAGMTGAVVGHQLGGTVLVVEKEPLYGGTTAKSGGVAWIPGNHRQAEVGISDTVEEGYSYLKGLIGDSVQDARVRAYAERAREMLQFMMNHSHVDYTPLPEYMDYYETVPGYKTGGRSMDPGTISLRSLGQEAKHIRIGHYDGLLMPFNVTVQEGRKLGEMNIGSYITGFRLMLRYMLDVPARLRRERDNRLTLGTGLVAKLRRSLMDRDIPVWLNTPMLKLLTENGRVAGAVVDHEGCSLRIRARRGVLLATGGFSQNAALRRQYQQAPVGADWSASAPGASGDGILMGQRVGAALEFMRSAWW
jgi:3-oxosteroid 1-dehydrogenase